MNMKYKCDMVKDLMPLCLDREATEASEQTVIEHLAECKECNKYYEALEKEIKPMEAYNTKKNQYVQLAKKIRKRKKITAMVVTIFIWIFCFTCFNYALGYRLNSRAAADISGRLNFKSKVIANFEWKPDSHFYIYDSDSCYDVIGVERTWLGWKRVDTCLNWPKWSLYYENIGIETAGTLCYFKYEEGVQIFPIISYDPNVKTVEVTCFGQTQTKEINTGEVTLFTFDAIYGQTNTVEANAYDAEGNSLYQFDETENLWIWVPVRK